MNYLVEPTNGDSASWCIIDICIKCGEQNVCPQECGMYCYECSTQICPGDLCITARIMDS